MTHDTLQPNEDVQEKEEFLQVINNDYIEHFEHLLADDKIVTVLDKIQQLDPADLGLLIERLETPYRFQLIDLIKEDFDPSILLDLPETVRSDLIRHIGIDGLVKLLPKLDSDDAFSLLESLEDHDRVLALSFFTDKNRASFERILSYPEDSAARMMQSEVVTVPSFWTAEMVIKFLRKSQNLPETFYEVYVVNSRHEPIGSILMNKLLRTSPKDRVESIMNRNLKTISGYLDQEEVAYVFRHYGLVSAPVIDESNRLIGMITADDVVDVIEEEAEKDIMQLAGVGNSDIHAPFFITSSRRFLWLIITFFNAILVSLVIHKFENVIERNIALAVLMPIVAAMGGTSGTQVIAVTVRALATRSLRSTQTWRVITKEGLIGCINGFLFSMIAICVVLFWYQDIQVALILTASLVFNMAWAAIGGVALPIMVEKFGWDPAISAGPLLTATTDVLGFASFLWLAMLFLQA